MPRKRRLFRRPRGNPDWWERAAVVFVVGILTILVWRLVHHALSLASVPTLTGG